MLLWEKPEKIALITDKSKLMNVNIKQTVGALKKKHIEPYVGQPSAKFRLFYRDGDGWMGDEELRFPKKMLYMVGLKTGDELHVELKK